VVGRFDELPEGRAVAFDVDGRRIAVTRIGASVHAIEDRCSHADVPLSEGSVDVFECAIECVMHGSMFDLRTGEPLSLPATRPVRVYRATVRDGDVVIEL